MIGIIQRTLSECLVEAGGEALRTAVFRDAGVPEDRVFRMDQNYPDEETGRLIDATLRLSGLDTEALFGLFSKTFIRFIREVFPQFMIMSENSEDLVRMQAKIHALIAAGMRSKEERDATTDKFVLVDHGPHRLTVRYRSQLQLCGLYKQLVRDMAAEFGDRVEIDTLDCRKAGAEACRFCVRWIAIGGRATDPDLHQPLSARLVPVT
jgi:hypothetical protein